MKLPFKLLIPAALVCFATVFAQAQTETPPPARPDADVPAKPHTDRKAHADHKAQMEKDLDLNEAQKAHFDKVNAEFKTKEKAARLQMAQDRKQRNEERVKALKSTLTPEQAAKFDKMAAERKAQHKDAKKGKGRKQ